MNPRQLLLRLRDNKVWTKDTSAPNHTRYLVLGTSREFFIRLELNTHGGWFMWCKNLDIGMHHIAAASWEDAQRKAENIVLNELKEIVAQLGD